MAKEINTNDIRELILKSKVFIIVPKKLNSLERNVVFFSSTKNTHKEEDILFWSEDKFFVITSRSRWFRLIKTGSIVH